MSIASKVIAGCTPIAGRRCSVEIPLITVFWGPTTVVFPSSVFIDSGDPEGTCVPVDFYYSDIAACAYHNVAYAYALPDESVTDPNPDVNPKRPWPACDSEAA